MDTSSSVKNPEKLRLETLERYELLDTDPEEAFDRITALAARKLDAPIALVGLVDRDRVWFKSRVGLDVSQWTRNPGGDSPQLLPEDICWVSDAAELPCLRGSDDLGERAIRFYAAAPLRTYNGYTLGTLAIMDHEPRALDPGQLDELRQLAGSLMRQIEARRLARNLERRTARQPPVDAAPVSTDPLTGLPDRHTFLERLERRLEQRSERGRGGAAVAVVDLDRFRSLNASLGYAGGDRLLIAAGHRLERIRQPGDLLARLGADTFVFLLAELGDGGDADGGDAERFAERVEAALAPPFELDGREVLLSASLGVAWLERRHRRADEVLRNAEIALEQGRSRGRRVELFDARDHGPSVERLELEAELRQALGRDELRLHYQPIVTLANGRVRGFEALVRWRHPRRGLLKPADFLAAAKSAGLLPALGDWTLAEACRRLRELRRSFPHEPRWPMSVNLDGRQLLRPGLEERIERLLAAEGLEPSALELEITEHTMVADAEACARTCSRLRERGLVLHIDDFGTGYATLSQLHQIPSQLLKIDRSFVAGMLTDPRHRAIVRGIVHLARDLGMEVVAEGVETAEVLQALREMGCDHAQGYYFSPPLSTDTLEERIADGTLWMGETVVN